MQEAEGTGFGVERQTVTAGSAVGVPNDAVWIDLLNPAPEQSLELLARLGVNIPTREEMEEIESSSRVYEQDGVAYMTALVVSRTDTDALGKSPVTLVLTPTHLVTVRFTDFPAIQSFAARCRRHPKTAESSAAAFAGLIETIVDRTADVLERTDAELAAISAEVFRTNTPPGQ